MFIHPMLTNEALTNFVVSHKHHRIADVAHFPHRPSLADIRELEFDFCRDFACCGQILGDLHDLLEHYEECHVRFEEEETVPMELTEDASVDDVLVSDDLDLTTVMPPLVGMKRVNLSDKDESIPVCPSAISNAEIRGHKRQRSVPPESPRTHLTIDTLNLPTSFSAVTTPTSLGEDFLAHAGLVDASSPLASFVTQDGMDRFFFDITMLRRFAKVSPGDV
jgi:hypothetical protein